MISSGVARLGGKRDVLAQRLAVRQMQIEPVDRDAAAAALDRDRLRRSLGGGDLVHLGAEPAETLDDRAVFGDLDIARDDERQRILHLAEGRGDLHQPAELDFLREIARRRDDERKHDRQLRISGGEPGQLLAAPDDAPPIQHDPRKAVLEHLALAALAAVERDVFGILAQPHHAEAKIGLVALLVEKEPDQRVADAMRQPGAGDRIDDCGKHHVARNIE